MAKRIPLPCTPANCGENFPVCGSHSTYTNRKCRCDSCSAASTELSRRYRKANHEAVVEKQNRYNRSEERVQARKQRYLENREAILDQHKRYRNGNREACAGRAKRWREANRETIRENKRQYHHANRETILDKQRRYKEANREAHRESSRQWRLANPERYRAHQRVNAQRRRARIAATQVVDFTREQLNQRMAYYGNRCYLRLPGLCTGNFNDVEHVKPVAKNGPHMLANLRPACGPCNKHKHDKWPFNFVG